jgi:hypothetical protein
MSTTRDVPHVVQMAQDYEKVKGQFVANSQAMLEMRRNTQALHEQLTSAAKVSIHRCDP